MVVWVRGGNLVCGGGGGRGPCYGSRKRRSRNPRGDTAEYWIPAFAGMTPQSRKEVIPPHRNALQPRRVKVNNCTADADKNHLHGRRNSRAGIVAQLRRAVLPPRYPPPQAGEGSEGAAAASPPYIPTPYHRPSVFLL